MRHLRAGNRAAVALTVLVALTGCGGSAGTDAAASASALAESLAQAVASASAFATAELPILGGDEPPGVDGETPASSSAALPPVTRQIDRTGWYDGFAITVREVTAEPGYGDVVDMTVTLLFENLGIDDNTPPEGDVQVDGLAVEAYFDAPGIPAGGRAEGTAVFSVAPEEALTPDEAIDRMTIVYGDAGDNQTVIPLAESAEVDSIEPADLEVDGTMTQGQIVVDVVQARLAPSYESGERGKALLDVRITLSCAPDCQASGWNTGYEQFSVTGPDGSSVVADQRSDYCCDALYPGVVSDSERNVLTFVVPLPGTGDYTLTYDNPNITSEGVAPATLTFTA